MLIYFSNTPLVAIINSDIPRAPNNDFDQSPEIKSKDITDIFVQGKEIILDKDIEDEGSPIPIVQNEHLEGIVTIFIRGKSGRIKPNNGEEELTFQDNNVELEYRDDLQVGDLVSFFTRPSTPRLIATKIRIIKSIDEVSLGDRIVGNIISFEKKRGSIQPRGGGDIFTFQENNIPVYLRSILRVGDKVTFLPSIKGTTRTARNINIHDSLVTKNLSGSLKSVQPGKYCIVEVEDGGPYAYFSYDQLPASVATDLKPDMKIEFDIINTPTGRQAINVRVPQITYKVDPQQLNQLRDYVSDLIQNSVSPISLGLLAGQIQNHFGDSIKNTQWLGYGSFKGLLQKLDLGGIEIVPIGPSYIYDPSRHVVPTTNDARVGVASLRSKMFSEQHPEIFDLAKQIRPIIEIPLISTKDFQDIFNEVANEVNENGFHLSQTGKSVRDRCKTKGISVNRSDISLVLRGIYYGGHSLGEGTENAKILGEAFVRNIVNLCKQSNLFFSAEEEKNLYGWIVGD
jgi:cold shock CspA family protein